MEIVIMITQFLLGISLIVSLHELGHMLLAKHFGMRVESYMIGFPPKLVRFQWGETEYALGLIPLGGSVKITGMLDESLDIESLKKAPQPWEFRAKPAWQRLIVIIGGILFNSISGILIFIILTFSAGETYLSKDECNKHGILPTPLGRSLGFQEGDRITHINGRDFKKITDVMSPDVLLKADSYYTIDRQGQVLHIPIPPTIIDQLATQPEGLVTPLTPYEIITVEKDSCAEQAGLAPGDQIQEIAGQATLYIHQLQAVLQAYRSQQVTVRYLRDGVIAHTVATVDATGNLGINLLQTLHYEHQSYGLGEAIAVGSHKALRVTWDQVLAIGKILTGKIAPSKALMGPIGMAQVFGKQFNWIKFWYLIGILSMVLAFMNILPIPALDGGHMLWILYEIATGRRPSDKFLETMQKIGFIILILLLGYTTLNDLAKLLWKKGSLALLFLGG